MSRTSPLIVIGLDGASWEVLESAADRGCIDFLSSKMPEGMTGTLRSTVPSLTCPAVPSLFSGLNPGRLGVFDFVKPNGDPVSSNDIPAPTLWEIASDQGRSCCVTNMRFAYPPRPVNGVLICGDLTTGRNHSFTHPPDLMEEIGDYHPEHIHERIEKMRRDRESHQEALLQDNVTVMSHRFDVFRSLMAASKYDLAIHWVGQTDSIQHHSWHHPAVVSQLYRAVDRKIEQLQEASPDANFLIVSDHGFDAAATQGFFVNTWLRQLGLLSGHAIAGTRLTTWLKRHLPKSWKTSVKNALRRYRASDGVNGGGGEGLIAFPDAYSLQPGIRSAATRAHLACQWGITVSQSCPPKERDEIIDFIITELPAVTDSGGKRVVQHAWRREELYSGEFVPYLPEVLFLTHSDYRAMPSLTRTLTAPLKPPSTMAGEHDRSREGVLIGWGPDIAPGSHVDADLIDIAPTALYLIDCAIPSDLDGSPLSPVVEADPRYMDPATLRQTTSEAYSEAERRSVRRRLENLGYL